MDPEPLAPKPTMRLSLHRFLGPGAAAALWALAAPHALAQQPPPRPLPPPTATASNALLGCVILPARSADIGTQIAGVVASIEVERGDTVKRGQVLAQMRADVEQASSSAARARANSEAEWRAATAGADVARQKLERARNLQAQNFLSEQAVELAESEYRVARERVAMALDQRKISAREAGGAEAQLSQRILRAPFDGVVTERFANPGERFEEKPLFRVADISQLRVDVVAPTALFGRLRMGQSLNIQPELPGAAARPAQVVQIDRVLDPASNTFRLRLSMDNADGALPAGLRCRADLGQAQGG